MTHLDRSTTAGRATTVRAGLDRVEADRQDAELEALAELGALRPRHSGFESFGFVVGQDGSATGGSASGALAAVGVVSGQLQPTPSPQAAVADEDHEDDEVIDLRTPPVAARPSPKARTPRAVRQS